jgi:hypothetical protein
LCSAVRRKRCDAGYAGSAPLCGAHALLILLPSFAGEVSRSYRDGGVMSHVRRPMTPPSAITRTPPQQSWGGTRVRVARSRPMSAATHAWGPTRQLSTEHDLTAYDAAYLELTLRRHSPLAATRPWSRLAARPAWRFWGIEDGPAHSTADRSVWPTSSEGTCRTS